MKRYTRSFLAAPTSTIADFPTRILVDESHAVTTVLKTLIEQDGKSVILVMHSYGGLVGSNAVPEELAYSRRRIKNLPGGVLRLSISLLLSLAKINPS
jgi:pimeloyl-ACP methyl ester carboxylesterase